MEYNVRKVQLIQLDILKQIIALCEKHNITYFAYAGTLLGAVRHKGFIPWDDDIDITMPRPDFDRFCEIAEQELTYPYFLQTNKTEPEYYLHIARVQNLQTTCIEEAFEHLNIKFGICVDIYPLDGVYDINIFRRWRRIYELCVTSWTDSRKCWKKYVKLIIGRIINIFFYGNQKKQFFYDKLETLYRKVNYNNADESVADWHSLDIPANTATYNKNIFAASKDAIFEDVHIKIPLDYDALLRRIYGEYMKLPPKEKQVAHHGYVAIDTDKPFTEYISKMRG